MNVHIMERNGPRKFQAKHDHSGHPEEDDVETCDQYTGGIERFHRCGIFGPAQGRKWPQCRGKPGIQNILILVQRDFSAVKRCCLFQRG